MNMDITEPTTLLELAMQSLLSNEPSAIHALQDIPRGLFVPLFNAAFKGGHKEILAAMVKVWPFFCLHIGTLWLQKPYCELLKAMVEGLQVLPAQNSPSWTPKLRILDLRKNTDCRTTCTEISSKYPMCIHSCVYSEHSILKMEAQHHIVNSESKTQSSRQAMELLVDLSLDSILRERGFLSLILNKVEQSLGFLHLCCRDLQIDTLSNCKDTMNFLDLVCIDHLTIDNTSLSEVNKLLCQMVHLDRLNLSNITFRSLNGKVFRTFLMQIGRMDNLKELNLSYFCLKNHLENLLRALPSALDFLYLPFCELSQRDFLYLSQCPQAKQLKLLNLSNNSMYLDDCENIQSLLDNISGTLKHLAINQCFLNDSSISVLLPALSRCSQLRVFSFISNLITMPMLMRIVQHLTPLMELKYVLYPIPLHCYDQWYLHGRLDQNKLADVKAQMKMMIQAAQREDMVWITYSQ